MLVDTSAAPVSMETFECPVCRVLLPSKNELTTHVSQHSDSVHMCVTCHQLFNSKEELKLHSVVHTREMSEKSKAMDPTPSPDKGTIPRLNHSFGGFDHSDRNFLGSDFQNASGNSTSKSDDDVEAYVMKQSPNAYACGFCSKSYSNRCNLKAHIRTHKGKQPFACTYCGKEFSSKCVLTVHVRSHTGEKPFPCEICGVSFSKQVHRNRHKSTHSGIKPFPCEICGKQFTRNDHVKRHIQNVHKDTKPYECVNCGVEFITSKEFSEHLEKHSRENDLFPTNSANISNFLKDGFDSRLQTPSNIQANIPLKDKTFTILP